MKDGFVADIALPATIVEDEFLRWFQSVRAVMMSLARSR